jgi:hypothetical protein
MPAPCARYQALHLLLHALHRWAIAQGPQAPLRDRLDQGGQRRAHASQCGTQIGGIGTVVPTLQVTGCLSPHDAHHVEPFAPAHRVLHKVQPGPQPGRDLVAAQMPGQTALRQQGSVSQVAGYAGDTVVQQLLAHTAPQTVGADQRLALDGGATSGLSGHGRFGGGIRQHFAVDLQRDIPTLQHRGQQQLLQIRAVHRGIRCAIALRHALAHRHFCQGDARLGISDLQPLRKRRHGRQGRPQAPAIQNTHDIGTELNTRAHLGKLCRTLHQMHAPAGTRAGQRCGQATNAAACDQYAPGHD